MIHATEPTLDLPFAAVPQADADAEPQGFVVEVAKGTRIHFLDWGEPSAPLTAGPPPHVLLLHGLAQTAWTWTPVARRLNGTSHVVAMDLRGHGLSDSPTDGYDQASIVNDVIAVADGSGLLEAGGPRLVIAGHGFGAIVAIWAAGTLGDQCGGLVLVDGGWEDVARTSGMEIEEFLRGLDEPPEVMRSMAAYLADRRDFDPGTWDADQERAARSMVVEAHSKRLTSATRPHAVTASVEAMFGHDPLVALPLVAAPVVALMAADDEEGTRGVAMDAAQRALQAAGRPPIRTARFPHAGHNLMRYQPREVAAAILAVAGTLRP